MVRGESYVGVSGVVSQDQQAELEMTADQLELSSAGYVLALGVKAVHNTQYLDRANKYGPTWYPVGEESFQEALCPSRTAYGIAQMYMPTEEIVSDSVYPFRFVERVMERGEEWIDAIQFDVLPYDNQDILAGWESLFEMIQDCDLDVILQCHKGAMSNGSDYAIHRLRQYAHALDFVLFDASHGRGLQMDADELKRFLFAANNDIALADEGIGFGVAGGLNADRVQSLLPSILKEFPDTSWDAEGQLHLPGSFDDPESDKSLDMQKTRDYLRASALAIKSTVKG